MVLLKDTWQTDKNILLVLQQIYGLSLHKALNLCKLLGIDNKSLYSFLSSNEKHKIEQYLTKFYKNSLDIDLKKQTYDNIKNLKRIKSYKGLRHNLCLSVNGQQTKTNAKTQKNKRKK